MTLKLEDFVGSKFEIDNSKLGRILGGAAPNTGKGSETVGEGSPYQTTISWSSDTVVYDESGKEESGTRHELGSEKDPYRA